MDRTNLPARVRCRDRSESGGGGGPEDPGGGRRRGGALAHPREEDQGHAPHLRPGGGGHDQSRRSA